MGTCHFYWSFETKNERKVHKNFIFFFSEIENLIEFIKFNLTGMNNDEEDKNEFKFNKLYLKIHLLVDF